jgi:hypothetical protein
MDLEYIGSNQHVYQLRYDGTAWHFADLSTTAGTSDAALGSALTSLYYQNGTSMQVFYVGSNQHVDQLYYSGGLWAGGDLTVATGAPNAAAGTTLSSDYNKLANTLEVEYIGSNQHVYQLWYNGTVWHSADLSTTAGTSNAAPGSGLTSFYNQIANTMQVVYIGSNQHLYQLSYNGTSWSGSDLTAATGAPSAATGTVLSSDYNRLANTMEVEYIGSNQHVYQLWYEVAGWHWADLTALAGAPLAN